MNWEYETDRISDCVIDEYAKAIPEVAALRKAGKLLLDRDACISLDKALLAILEAAEKKQGQTLLAAKLRVAVSVLGNIRDYFSSPLNCSPVRQWADRALARIDKLEEENG